MATIVNDRDIALQATTPRLVNVTLPDNIIVPALKGIDLTAPSSTFQVSAAGVASPASIVLTATLRQITGTVVFSVVAGTAALTGSGNTRTLAYAGASTASVTIRASVTEGVTVYASELTIAKVRDGEDGVDGTAYLLTIESTNGTVFRVGQNSTTLLEARLFKNGAEVTSTTPAEWFRWTRVSATPRTPPNDDATWNAAYASGYRQLSLSVDDVQARATFSCEIVNPATL